MAWQLSKGECRHVKVSQPGVDSPRIGLNMSEPNPAHFMSHKFCNQAQPTTGWWVKWVGLPTHLKKIFIYWFNYAFGPHFGVKISKWYPNF